MKPTDSRGLRQEQKKPLQALGLQGLLVERVKRLELSTYSMARRVG